LWKINVDHWKYKNDFGHKGLKIMEKRSENWECGVPYGPFKTTLLVM
jgi:hypothetical protein